MVIQCTALRSTANESKMAFVDDESEGTGSGLGQDWVRSDARARASAFKMSCAGMRPRIDWPAAVGALGARFQKGSAGLQGADESRLFKALNIIYH